VVGGLVHADARRLDEWVLTVNGARSFDLRSSIDEREGLAPEAR
jgi:hypothetical protein